MNTEYALVSPSWKKVAFILLLVPCTVFFGSSVVTAAAERQDEAAEGLPQPLKVLVLAPNRDYSHFALSRRLAQLLADRGHHVVCVLLIIEASKKQK
jgi:hypothetical protein